MKALALALCMGLIGVQVAVAQSPPRLVHAAGVARDAAGNLQADSAVVTFAIYATPEGGDPIWSETQSLKLDAAGQYSTLLGVTAKDGLPEKLFTAGEPRWLAVSVNGGPEGARMFWASVPYALKAADAETVGGLPVEAFVLSGAYRDSSSADPERRLPALDTDGSLESTMPVEGTAELDRPADFVINDDLIAIGSTCTGLDCVNGEVFGFDTLRLKENNTRLQFNDTSNSASFPSNNWQIRANSSANGGGNFLAFVDQGTNGNSESGNIVFSVEAGARANALYVESDGDVGIGTANPVLDIHALTGNTPSLRLDQDGSSGFTPQTWDIAANEANFFIRDVTAGSRLPFRIRPGAPSSAIDIAANGNVGINESTPEANLEITRSGDVAVLLSNTGTSGTRWEMKNNSFNGQLEFRPLGGGLPVQFSWAGTNDLLRVGVLAPNTVDINGNLVVTGGCTGCLAPDYVFEPDYQLRPLKELEAFVTANKHLPGVPSAAEISANGINMRDMNYALLEKIEELVLYTLQQQKAIDELQERLKKLEAAKQ